MQKRKLLTLLLALALTLAGCSAGDSPKIQLPTAPAALNIQLGGEPDTLDPAFAQTAQEESYLLHLLEGLTVLDDQQKPQPGAASGWELTQTEEGIQAYRFTLDPNAKWSDGQAVTAQDFIYAWKRTLDPATQSPVAYKLYPIRGAQAVHLENADSETLGVSVTEAGELVVELEASYPDLLQRMASPAWAPLRQSAVTAKPTGWFYSAETYLTNGPYQLTQWERDQFIAMEKNKNYRNKGEVKAQKLNFVLVQEEEALLSALQDGTLQLAVDLPQLVLEKQAVTTRDNAILGSYLLALNTQQAPFDNPKVRQALSMALDRELLARAMQDGSLAATGLVPPGATVGGQDLRKTTGDLVSIAPAIDKAKELLAEAGYPQGEGLTVRYLLNDEAAHQRVAEEIKRQWETLGVTVELDVRSWNEYEMYREDGKFDVVRLALFADGYYPDIYFDSWASDSPLNFAAYQSHDYDVLVDQSYGRPPRAKPVEQATPEVEGQAAQPQQEGQEDPLAGDALAGDGTDNADSAEGEVIKTPGDYLAQAERLLVAEDAAVVPLTWYANRYLVAEGFQGWKSYPTGAMYFGRAFFQKTNAG